MIPLAPNKLFADETVPTKRKVPRTEEDSRGGWNQNYVSGASDANITQSKCGSVTVQLYFMVCSGRFSALYCLCMSLLKTAGRARRLQKKSNGTQQSKTQNYSFFLYLYDSKSEFTWKWTLWTAENIKAARNHWKILACYYSYPIKMSLLIITCKCSHDVHGAVISSGGSAMLIWVCNGRFAVCWQYSAAQRDQTAGGDGDDFVWSLAGL